LQIDLQLESGEYFLKPYQKEAREAKRRKEKVSRPDSVILLTTVLIPPDTARRSYRQAAGGASRGVRTPKGRCGSYSGREEKTEAERESGRRGGRRKTAQEQEEKEGDGGGLLISASSSCLMLSYHPRSLIQTSDRSLFEVS